jgi:HK97 family phage portal protein
MYDLIDGGWGLAWIRPGPRGFADRLVPIEGHRLVKAEQITEGLSEGKWLFHIRDAKNTGRVNTYTEDDVFYLRGAEGKGILERARESLGTARSTEAYAANIFSKGTLSGGFIEIPGDADEEANRRLAKSLLTKFGEWHFPKILPNGAKLAPNTLTPEDAQMLLSRKFSINDIARWLGLPPHMLGDLDRATFSNIEHQGQEFVTFSLGPWLSLWEHAINSQLILANRFYAEFVRDAIVRGDLLTRWQAYQIQIQTGTRPRNEIRRSENLRKLPGLDEPIDPAFLQGGRRATDPQAPTPGEPRPGAPKPAAPNKAQAIVQESAARLLRKEIAAVQKLAVRHAADGDAFAVAVTEFYAKHVELVAETLQMAATEADRYCATQAAQVVNGDWISALEQWATDTYAAGLAALALEVEAA